MPKKVKKASDWEKVFNKDEDEYNNYVKRIGNHTLLDEKLNITASNKDFKLKKNDNYKKSRLELNIELVKKKTWNYKIIETRQAELYELVNKLEIWKL